MRKSLNHHQTQTNSICVCQQSPVPEAMDTQTLPHPSIHPSLPQFLSPSLSSSAHIFSSLFCPLLLSAPPQPFLSFLTLISASLNVPPSLLPPLPHCLSLSQSRREDRELTGWITSVLSVLALSLSLLCGHSHSFHIMLFPVYLPGCQGMGLIIPGLSWHRQWETTAFKIGGHGLPTPSKSVSFSLTHTDTQVHTHTNMHKTDTCTCTRKI